MHSKAPLKELWSRLAFPTDCLASKLIPFFVKIRIFHQGAQIVEHAF